MKRPAGKAVFIDRDGVLSREINHLRRISDLRLISGATLAVKKMRDKGYHVVVVSNQSVIARGMATHATVDGIHGEIVRRLARKGARLDGVYYCPHHPAGKIKKYAIHCKCRKPKTGMITKAAKDLNLDLKKSFFVGDQTSDLLAGERAGMKTILVKTGYGGSDGLYEATPDFIARDLYAATKFI